MLTYNDAAVFVSKGRNGSKKIGHNTYVEDIGNDTFGVRLHNTYVVRIYKDGTYTLHSGGWRTVTTKDRINANGPAKVYQKNHVWYVGNVPFTDGMRVDANGQPVTELAA